MIAPARAAEVWSIPRGEQGGKATLGSPGAISGTTADTAAGTTVNAVSVEEVPEDVARVAREAIEPVLVNGKSAAVPILLNKDGAYRAAVDLIVRTRQLLAAADGKPSLLAINTALGAYNHLVVMLGLTDPAQLAHFPRVQTIGLALAEIREQNAGLGDP